MIAAERHAQVVEQACAAFGRRGPPVDLDARRAAIAKLGDTALRRWSELDKEFSALQDDPLPLLRDYVVGHKREFRAPRRT